ncbi:unnamed protein product [Arctia plantaginis]|uniref:Uncharacterized protein n=1 Tax=Arctia plantaginis TaxID=874455 RepID=A0A8S0ZEC1_ARCPL|nr:unnamed protein product [Arctia plantaginis]
MASFMRPSSMTNCDTIVSREDGESMQQDEKVLNEVQKGLEKRLRENSEENDREEDCDSFVTVTRKSKRLLRSYSVNSNQSGEAMERGESFLIDNIICVCLPTQSEYEDEDGIWLTKRNLF